MASDLIYLDYAATTPLDARVADRMLEVQRESYFNPASNHVAGRRAAAVVDVAGKQLGSLLNVAPSSFVFTSGATESNNLAIAGVARQREHRGKHLVTMRTEHKAVVDVFRSLEKQGFEISWLDPGSDGLLSSDDLSRALRDDTQLVSIMHVNNETGAIQDLGSIGEICRQRDVLLHVDGAQAAGKITVDLQQLMVDLYSLTAHKFYGPKGIAALYMADGTAVSPLMFGGGQQKRIRPGTLAVDLIAGLGEAAAIAEASIDSDLAKLAVFKSRLLAGIETVDGLVVNGPLQGAYPGILNVSVADVEGESLLLAMEPVCVATGSACNSQSMEPSYVLRSLGLSDAEAQGAIRFSFGRTTTTADIDAAIARYRDAVDRLRSLAPAVVT